MAGSRGQAARSIEVVRSDGLRITLAEQRRTLWQEVLRARVAYLSLLPLFLALGIFVYFPPLSAMYHAFFDWNPSGQSTFVGLGNFQTMLSDNVLARAGYDGTIRFWPWRKLLGEAAPAAQPKKARPARKAPAAKPAPK